MNRVGGVFRATLAPLIVVSILLAGCASPAQTPPRESPESEAPPSSEPAAAGDLDLGDIVWVYTPPASTFGGPNGAFRLEAGTLAADEPILNLQVPWRAELGEGLAREPAIGAPHGGAVVYVADDGARSEVHRAEIATDGADQVLAALDEVVWDIAVAPDQSAAYAAVVDRADPTRDLGVVRILLDGSGTVEPMMAPAPAAATDAVRRVAVLAFQIHLAISSDGRHLARRTCHEAGTCVVDVVDVATRRTLDLPDREVLGIVAGVIVARGCDGPGCGLQAIDIETGAVALAGIDVSGRVVDVGGAPAVVAMISDATGPVTVEAIDPSRGRRSVLHRVPEGTDIIYGDFLFLQMDLPAGVIHLIQLTPNGEDGGAGRVQEQHLLLSIVEGRTIEVPRPAFTQPGGPGSHG